MSSATEQAGTQCIVLRVGSESLIAEVSCIDEVADTAPMTPLPDTVSWFRGLASHKGRLLPVSDLGGFCGAGMSEHSATAKWLVVRHGTEKFILVVDEVIGLITRDSELEQSVKSESDEDRAKHSQALAPVIRGLYPVDGGQAAFVDLQGLLALPGFLSIGAESRATGTGVAAESGVS